MDPEGLETEVNTIIHALGVLLSLAEVLYHQIPMRD